MTVSAIAPSSGGSTTQFGRHLRLVIGGPVKPDSFSDTGASREVLIINDKPNAQGFDDLRIKAKFVWQATNPTPNNGTVEVWGLDEIDRKFCVNAHTPVAAYAAYGDNTPVLIGALDAVQISSKHDGPDWITKFQGGNGSAAFASSHMRKSYAGGTPVINILKDMIAASAATPGAGIMDALTGAAAGKTMKNGYAIHERPRRAMKGFLDELGFDHTIQNGELIAFPRGGTTKQVILINAESGMIGSPEYSAQPKPGKPKQLNVTISANPLIRPACTVRLESEEHTGNYRLLTIEADLQNYGDGPWQQKLGMQELN